MTDGKLSWGDPVGWTDLPWHDDSVQRRSPHESSKNPLQLRMRDLQPGDVIFNGATRDLEIIVASTTQQLIVENGQHFWKVITVSLLADGTYAQSDITFSSEYFAAEADRLSTLTRVIASDESA